MKEKYVQAVTRSLRRPAVVVVVVVVVVVGRVLLLIDRHDSYQLMQFILTYKKFQFVLNGLAGLFFVSVRGYWSDNI